MLLSLLLITTLTPISTPTASVQFAAEAQGVCRQYLQVRLGAEIEPEEHQAQRVPNKEGEWLVDGKVKGPEGPLLFACHLRHAERWELLNFSLWAPQPIKRA